MPDTWQGQHSINVFTAPGVEGEGKAAGWYGKGPMFVDGKNLKFALTDEGFAITQGNNGNLTQFNASIVVDILAAGALILDHWMPKGADSSCHYQILYCFQLELLQSCQQGWLDSTGFFQC
jgi:hypothetical protein